MRAALPSHELRFIQEAADFLEKPSALICATDRLGKPLDKVQDYMPAAVQKKVKQAAQAALKTALQLAIKSLPSEKAAADSWPLILNNTQRSAWKHTAAVTTTGALGGALGTAAMMLELPLTTGLMLRSISSMAQEWGHDLKAPEIQMQCLYVFTLGSPRSAFDDEMDTAYISARLAWNGLIRELAAFISTHSVKEVIFALEKGSLPALVRLASLLLPSFERAILRGALSKSVPVISAVGSAALNAGFCQYFTRAARFHFGLMHLEAKYGRDCIHELYQQACQSGVVRPDVRLIS